jgi:hypothetical protein
MTDVETNLVSEEEPECGCELLPLPETLPDNAYVYQLISVVVDQNDDFKVHVNFAYEIDHAESWGEYLAEFVHIMARDRREYLNTDRSDGDLLAGMSDGFNKRLKLLQRPCNATAIAAAQ